MDLRPTFKLLKRAVFGQVADLMGESGAEAIREMLANVSEPGTGSMAAIVSTALLVFGATTVFGQLQTALDTVSLVLSAALSALGK